MNRFIFADKYFKVLRSKDKKNEIIGFVCSTKINGDLNADSMSLHDINGKTLGIHSVVINKKYRRQGLGYLLVKKYIDDVCKPELNNNIIKNVHIICKQHLVQFYKNCGFNFIGQSKIVHGKDKWFDMVLHKDN